VELIDVLTLQITHVFTTKPFKDDTLRCFHSPPRKGQLGSINLTYLALAYMSEEDGSCVLQTYFPKRDGDTICIRDPSSTGIKKSLSDEMLESVHVVEDPGEWDILPVGYVVGAGKIDSAQTTREDAKILQIAASGLRRRGHSQRSSKERNDLQQDDQWEAWSLSIRGEKSTMKLSGDGDTTSELLVSSLGPLEIISRRSLAVGLGNVVKIVTVGDERYDNEDVGNPQDTVFAGTASGRKKKNGVGRKKPGTVEKVI
jgi:hypothetical protein